MLINGSGGDGSDPSANCVPYLCPSQQSGGGGIWFDTQSVFIVLSHWYRTMLLWMFFAVNLEFQQRDTSYSIKFWEITFNYLIFDFNYYFHYQLFDGGPALSIVVNIEISVTLFKLFENPYSQPHWSLIVFAAEIQIALFLLQYQ